MINITPCIKNCTEIVFQNQQISSIIFFYYFLFCFMYRKKMENHISKCSNFVQQIFKKLFLVCPMICLFNFLFQFKKLRCCECKCKAFEIFDTKTLQRSVFPSDIIFRDYYIFSLFGPIQLKLYQRCFFKNTRRTVFINKLSRSRVMYM